MCMCISMCPLQWLHGEGVAPSHLERDAAGKQKTGRWERKGYDSIIWRIERIEELMDENHLCHEV